MHRATWQVDLDTDAELARRATYAATEAAGRIPCLKCGHPAVVYVRVQAMRFAAECCDTCAAERMQYAAIARATVELDKLVGVTVVTSIDDVDLAAYARECLDGVVAECDLAAMANIPGAAREIAAALSGRLRRPLVPSEQLAVGLVTHAAYYARRAELKALLRDTQSRLASPFRTFAS